MAIKIGILVIGAIGFGIYFYLDLMTSMLRVPIALIIENKQKEEPDKEYFSVFQILSELKSGKYDIDVWSYKILQRVYLYRVSTIKRAIKTGSSMEESPHQKNYFGFKKRMEDETVRSIFDWEDETVYEWKFMGAQKSMIQRIYQAVQFWFYSLLVPILVLSVAEYFFHWLPFVIIIFMVYQVISSKLDKNHQPWDAGSRFNLMSTMQNSRFMVLFTLSITTSVMIYLLSSPLIPVDTLFENYTTNKISWLLYSTENIINGIFYDITEVLGVSFTSLEAASSFGRILMGVINFMILATIVELILTVYRSMAVEQFVFRGTTKELMKDFGLNFIKYSKCQLKEKRSMNDNMVLKNIDFAKALELFSQEAMDESMQSIPPYMRHFY